MPEKEKLVEQIRMVVLNELEKQRLESDIDKNMVSAEQVKEIIREEIPAFLARNTTTIEGILQLLDGRNISVGSSTGSKIGTVGGASGQKLGFFSATPVVEQTSGANLTNNVASGGTDNTIANFTDLSTYANDAAAIRNDIYQLARKLKQINDGLRLLGFFD